MNSKTKVYLAKRPNREREKESFFGFHAIINRIVATADADARNYKSTLCDFTRVRARYAFIRSRKASGVGSNRIAMDVTLNATGNVLR